MPEFRSRPLWVQGEKDAALRKWADFLLGHAPDPGRFELHFFPLDELASYSGRRLPENINRYMLRAVDVDVAHRPDEAIVYVKLPYMLILGLLRVPRRHAWRGTRVSPRRGVVEISHGRYAIEEGVASFMFQKARRLREIEEAISGKQRAVINAAYESLSERAAGSVTIRAAEADARLVAQRQGRRR